MDKTLLLTWWIPKYWLLSSPSQNWCSKQDFVHQPGCSTALFYASRGCTKIPTMILPVCPTQLPAANFSVFLPSVARSVGNDAPRLLKITIQAFPLMHDQIWRAGTIRRQTTADCQDELQHKTSFSRGAGLRTTLSSAWGFTKRCLFTSHVWFLRNTPSHPSRPSLGSPWPLSCTSSFPSSFSRRSIHSWKDDLSRLQTYQERFQVACDDISASSSGYSNHG